MLPLAPRIGRTSALHRRCARPMPRALATTRRRRQGEEGGLQKAEVVDFGVKLEHEEGLRDEVEKLRMPRGWQAGPPKVSVNQTALKHEGPYPLYIP